MNIVFMGTPEFAVPSLQILVEAGYTVKAVITAPNKKSGRGLKVRKSEVCLAAEELGLPVLQPTNLKDPGFQQELADLKPDLAIVVAFRMLPESVWNMPAIGTFNLHASLLPNYRGAAPIHWAVINGEEKTGVTTFMLKHEIDTGDLLFQEEEPIHKEDTTGDLYERLMSRGSKLVLKTVRQIEQGAYELKPQVLTPEVKKAPKIFKETCRINFEQPAEKVYNFVRGLNPFPSAWTVLEGKTFKIHQAKLTDKPADAFLDTDNKSYLNLACADYYLSITELQLEGKKRMNIQDFLRGYEFEL